MVSGPVIYEPKGQALEYAPLAANLYRGCGHTCAYCYVPPIIHMRRPDFDKGAVYRPGALERLEKDARYYKAAGCTAQIFFSFTTDPYHPGDTAPTRRGLEILRDHDLSFCTLTKGGTRALRDHDLFRPKRDAFAITLTSTSREFARKWERNAAEPLDRVDALRRFHTAGIFTWISLEPTLDIEHSLAVVKATHRYVDLYKVGRANYLKEITRTTDWRDYTLRMIDLLQRLGKAHYIKQDLQEFLPTGYHNPLRVAQHHG